MKLIAAKLTKIMKDCAYVQKTGVNEFHRYKYAKAAAILEKANDSMVENNVSSKVMPKECLLIRIHSQINIQFSESLIASIFQLVLLCFSYYYHK